MDATREILVNKIIEQQYLSRTRPSIQEIVRLVGRRCAEDGCKPISRNAIRARVQRLDPRTRIRARYGAKAATDKHAATPGQFPVEHVLESVGRLVCEWRPTSIRTEQLPVQSYAERRLTRSWLRRTEKCEQFDAILPADHEALSLGSGPGRLTMPPLTLTEMIRYQCASGEDSAGHHDVLAAQAFGYPDVFSVGMHHAGALATYACHWLGPHNVREFRARFLDMVWVGDELSYDGVITGFAESPEGETVHVELNCRRDGVVVVRAWARFLLA